MVAVLVSLLVASCVTAIARARWERRANAEAERARELEGWAELVQVWVREIRLKYGVVEKLPPVGGQEEEAAPEGAEAAEGEQLEEGAVFTTASARAGFDWQAVVASCQAPGWEFTDSAEEYLAWALRESHLNGDPTGKSSHLWRTGQALRNGGHTYPMSDGFRQAAKELYAATCIDDLLREKKSPLSGYGINFILSGVKYGVSPYLLIALTAAESTFATDGSLCRTHHNAWGMKGPNKTGLVAKNGWMWWPDWPSAIDGAAYFISVYWPGARTAYDLRGYCEGNPPAWIRNVEVVREAMGGVM